MDNQKIIEDFHTCIEQKDFDSVSALLADDFEFSGAMPKPMGKQEFVGSHKALLGAFSNFSYNLGELQGDGNKVRGTVQVSGMHSQPLDLSFMQGPVVPATGKAFQLSPDDFEATLEGVKIRSIQALPRDEDGGMGGLLKVIGVEIPG